MTSELIGFLECPQTQASLLIKSEIKRGCFFEMKTASHPKHPILPFCSHDPISVLTKIATFFPFTLGFDELEKSPLGGD